MKKTDVRLLTGQSHTHIDPKLGIHIDVVHPFLNLQRKAQTVGMELTILSGFRSFEQQLKIWNEKANGKRPLLDRNSRPFSREEREEMDDLEKIHAILAWSALPGASRHHWGTDMDIYDKAAMVEGYKIELIPEEYEGEGIFSQLGTWLDIILEGENHFGFYRPYVSPSGGTSPEPWHLSYRPLAEEFSHEHDPENLRTLYQGQEIALKECLLANLEDLWQRYVDDGL